jgi:hypothetical protein
MKYTSLIIFLISCNSSNNREIQSLSVKQYRNGELISTNFQSGSKHLDTGYYCLVSCDSSQMILLDSTFYLNGLKNGYSKKRENSLYVIGNYLNGNKTGWFDYFDRNTIKQSDYFNQDTLIQRNIPILSTLDSAVIFIPELSMNFVNYFDTKLGKQTINWVPIKFHDSLKVYIVTGVSRVYKSNYVVTDEFGKKFFEFDNCNQTYIKITLSNKGIHKYYISTKSYIGETLFYTNKELLLTTPFVNN